MQELLKGKKRFAFDNNLQPERIRCVVELLKNKKHTLDVRRIHLVFPVEDFISFLLLVQCFYALQETSLLCIHRLIGSLTCSAQLQ